MVEVNAINASVAYAKALSSQVDGVKTGGADPFGGANNGPSFAELVKETGMEAIADGKQSEKVSLQSLTQDTGLAEIVTAVSNAEASLETVEAGKILGIRVLDHVVVARRGYASLLEERTAGSA